MSSFDPPSSCQVHDSLMSPGPGNAVSSSIHGKHTTIDPFGSLCSHHSLENSGTPRTPVDPMYLHPSHAENDSISVSMRTDTKSVPSSASAIKVTTLQVGSQHQPVDHSSKLNKSSSFVSQVNEHDDDSFKLSWCDYPKELNLPTNLITTQQLHDSNTYGNEQIRTSKLTTNNGEITGTKGRGDRSSDMVVCEPGGFMSLLSRSFQFVVSVFRAPPLKIEFQVVCEKANHNEESDPDDISDDDDDDVSQDSSFDSQPSSPQTPLCYSNSSRPLPKVSPHPSLPPPQPSPAFCSPKRPTPGGPGYMGLPPNWLSWRPSYGGVDERRRRRGPPPLLPTLSDDHRGNSRPILPPRPLPDSQFRWTTLHTEWIVPLESPRQTAAASPTQAGALFGTLVKPHPSHSLARLGPSVCCPISGGIMIEPVIDPDGFSYEKRAILEWLANHTTSPITDQPLAPHQLRPNRTLQCVIQSLLQNTEGIEYIVGEPI